jgi:hypothetical protein
MLHWRCLEIQRIVLLLRQTGFFDGGFVEITLMRRLNGQYLWLGV